MTNCFYFKYRFEPILNVVFEEFDTRLLVDEMPFTGIKREVLYDEIIETSYVNGVIDGIVKKINLAFKKIYLEFFISGIQHGYSLLLGEDSFFCIWDAGEIIEFVHVRSNGKVTNFNLLIEDEKDSQFLKNDRETWKMRREDLVREGYYKGDRDLLNFYRLQNSINNLIISKDQNKNNVKYIGGSVLTYNELEQKMLGVFVVLDADSLELVDQAYYEMDITFPYMPELFAFREIFPFVEAFNKLEIKPDLIICDGHGTAHPKSAGRACLLGIELDLPTIGCAKNNLIGKFEDITSFRGSTSNLIYNGKIVGTALRTQNFAKPMFVSIGHKLSIDTAIQWTLRLCTQNREPEPIRKASILATELMKDRNSIYFFDINEND